MDGQGTFTGMCWYITNYHWKNLQDIGQSASIEGNWATEERYRDLHLSYVFVTLFKIV